MGKTFEKKLPYKKAICYSGYREGQCPTGEMPSKEQISEDLHLLVADGYGYIRMYEPRIWMQSPMRSTSSVFIPTHTIWMLQLRMHLRKQRKASSLHKQICFTELGWATRTAHDDHADYASVANQKRYLEEVADYLKSEEIVGFVFEAFDELWKDPSSPAASECNWGIYDINRKKKW